jgi:hypothetical protein
MRAAIYDDQGIIRAIVGCPENQLQQQDWANRPYIRLTADQQVDMDKQMVVDGQLVDRPIDPTRELAKQYNRLRSLRNMLLANCDWTQMPDAALSSDKKAAWAAYRQQLRDIPANTPDPTNYSWPTPPPT